MKPLQLTSLPIKIILFCIPLLWFVISWLFGQFHKKTLFPIRSNKYTYSAFCDHDDNPEGKSKILSFKSDSERIACEFVIDSGITYPFAGISVKNGDQSNFFSLKGFNRLHLECIANEPLPLQVSIITEQRDFTRNDDLMSFRPNTVLLNLKKGLGIRDIPFSTFKTPQWWFEHWQKQSIDFSDHPDYQKIISLQFQSTPFTAIGIPVSIQIMEISVWYDMTLVYYIGLAFTVIYYLMITVWYLSKRFHTNKNEVKVIAYEKLSVTSHEDTEIMKIVNYIGINYSNPEISLESIVKNTGVSSHKVSQLLNRQFQKDFKEYLQDIRMNEARRLLCETDRQVTEIADLVGFNYCSSFTRAFKKHFSSTPKDMRKG